MKNVPIPERMQSLATDVRGLPVPYVVLIDKSGKPQFTVNDVNKSLKTVQDQLCHVCGQELVGPAWFVGGPLSAFHPQGAFADGPMHDECAHYSLQVCPYMGAPKYGSGMSALDKLGKVESLDGMFVRNNTMIPGRPKLFVAVKCESTVMDVAPGVIHFIPEKPYLNVEFWQNGQQIGSHAGVRLVAEVLFGPAPQMQAPTVGIVKSKPKAK